MKDGLIYLSSRLSSGEVDLNEFYANMIVGEQELDGSVQSLLQEVDREARLDQEIGELIERYPDIKKRPPLFGVPFGVKDIFHVEGLETRAGSQLPPEELMGAEAVAVTRLRAAGALVYAKTVTTEFGYFAPGPTRNPHNPAHTPGGSSSGSAAAVGGGILPLATGTQTIGSILRPAGFCGVVGYKPSYDRISRDGVIPLSPSVDHIGFFVRNMEDAELVASVLVDDWRAAGPQGMPRLGIPSGPYLDKASDDGLAHFESVQAHLLQSGFDLVSVPVMANFEEIRERHNQIVAADAAMVHEDWYGRYGDRYHPETRQLIQKGTTVKPEDLAMLLAGREELRADLTTAAERHGVDLWISPSAPGAAPAGIESTGDPVMNLPWTHAGLPSVGVPSGKNDQGLPFGLQIVGSWMGDEKLFAWAKVIERVLPIN